jgi:pyruvate kinase
MLSSRKSIALPGAEMHTPTMTETDRENISIAGQYGVTAVMQPFVRDRKDLETVRAALNDAGSSDIQLFAKIENMEGVSNLDDLIPACDEIVIARGDLGNAMPLWELPRVQKNISVKCRCAQKKFMVVTQMLASMEHNAVPTRAEVSDIFNAVCDGAASVMVTGETAVGEHPAEAIRYLANTVREAQAYLEGRC